ncbi:MAG: hypothetical protein M0D53_01470 [Flavobacterium sp. JAD_PAG50586_2]|nr:MAG: hypothetical protein M0D53_01470 [Flavobacterium sp. JAD_PAG50586_2]
MMKILHILSPKTMLIALLIIGNASLAQSIWTNPITGSNPNSTDPYTIGQTVDANITVSGIGRGSGITGNAGNDRFNATAWTTSGLDLTDYYTFTLTPAANYKINLSSFEFTLQRSSTGPVNYALRSSIDNFTADISTGAFPMTAALQTVALSGAAFQNITSAITFRIYGYNAGSNVGTASVNDFTFNGTTTTLANDEFSNKNTILIYKQYNGLVVSSDFPIANLVIYDLQGRLLYNRMDINSSTTIINDAQIENQILVVRITTFENQVVIKKIFY